MIYILTVTGTNISPRFDMTTEILIAETDGKQLLTKPRTILLNKTSSDDICELIIHEGADCLVCGGIEERFYKYLSWKKTSVIESVIGSTDKVLKLVMENKLTPGAILQTN